MAKWIYYNPHPNGSYVGDCFIRAISKATGMTWHETLQDLLNKKADCFYSYQTIDTQDYLNEYLVKKGFKIQINNDANLFDETYTVNEFCDKYPIGTYIVSVCVETIKSDHLLCIKDGHFYDTGDVGEFIILDTYKKDETTWTI